MNYLLSVLSISLATALAFVLKQLQQSKKKYVDTKQQLQQAEQNYLTAQRKVKELDRKYGSLISRDEAIKELDRKISLLQDQLNQLHRKAKSDEQELTKKINLLHSKLQTLEEKEFLEDCSFYESKYDFAGAEIYKNRLDKIRSEQKMILKNKQAAFCHTEWSVEGSLKEGKKMTDNFIKLILRAFNGECDAAIMKVKYNNVQVMENRIRKTYEDLNKLSETTHCEITSSFLNLKLEELWLTHEYQEKKYQEQEEQRIIREQIREEEKAIRELEKARRQAEEEEHRYQEALEKARKEVELATGKSQEKLLSKIDELEKYLAELEINKQRAISQAQMTKLGHVYIISNIGSFGENVYKIGMTRRLEPMERVKELGDASVPFPFDVHAMIFCENAPELESQLHKRFSHRRMNKINDKKEFFRVSLDEIIEAVHEIDEELNICKSNVTFTKVAEARDYRQTITREQESESKS